MCGFQESLEEISIPRMLIEEDWVKMSPFIDIGGKWELSLREMRRFCVLDWLELTKLTEPQFGMFITSRLSELADVSTGVDVTG